MFESLVHEYEEALCDVYLDLFIKSEESRQFELEDSQNAKDDRHYRFSLFSEILSHLREMTILGNQAKQIKYLA